MSTVFSIYSFTIRQSEGEQEIFSQQNEYKTYEELLASFFNAGSTVQHVGRTAGSKPYKADVLHKAEGVILFTLENNAHKTTMVNKKPVQHDHHPFCPVIIDYRPEHRLVAAPLDKAFDKDPDKIMTILHHTYNKLLSPYHLQIEFEMMTRRKEEFMPIVNSIRTTFKDRVKYIKLEFSGEEDDTLAKESNPQVNDYIGSLLRMANSSKSDGLFEFRERNQGGVDVDAIDSDLSIISQICRENKGYALAVSFDKFGIYRYGMDLRATFGLEDEILNDFRPGSQDIFRKNGYDFDLPAWFDRISNFTEGYDKNMFVGHRRTTRRRR